MDEEQQEDSGLDEPMKPKSPLKRAQNAGKTVVKSTINFTRDAVRFFLNPAVPLPVKIVLIVVVVIIILVVVVLEAEADEQASAVGDTVYSYIYQEGADEEGTKYFKEKGSLIKYPLKDINAMYEKFKTSDDFTSTEKNNYDFVLGTNEIKDGDNPDATNSSSSSSGGGTANPNGDESEGYQSAFTDTKNRTYKIYKQYMEPWASHSYWNGKMSGYGCGPTTLAIIASGYKKNNTPAQIADYMNENYGYTGDQSLSGTLTNYLSIKNTIYQSDYENKIKDNLNAGRPVIISVGSSPDTRFTGSSHIMCLLSIKDNKEVYIGNVGANDNNASKCGWNSLSGIIPYITYIITIDVDS